MTQLQPEGKYLPSIDFFVLTNDEIGELKNDAGKKLRINSADSIPRIGESLTVPGAHGTRVQFQVLDVIYNHDYESTDKGSNNLERTYVSVYLRKIKRY